MTDGTADRGWFEGVAADDLEGLARAIREGSAERPRDWPALAVEAGFADDEAAYYDCLQAAAIDAASAATSERERAPDQQLVHALRAAEDLVETTNELAERLAEWGASAFGGTGGATGDADSGVAYAHEVAARDPGDPTEERIVAIAGRVVDLDAEREALRAFVEAEAPRVAPNLAAIAGPMLAARLIALAGGLEALAKKPSSTVQVLGAEDALFAHLQGRAPSPKHGAIYVHEYVRGTRPEDRGSAARALAGKLAIAARVDHYSGERKPEIDAELEERIDRIRSRGES